jgi:peptidoglycan/xylan/chitin deacetylase (PgdA/CDA1 family)
MHPFTWARQAASAAAGRRHPFVLCYHGVGEVPPERDPAALFIPEKLFAEHLDLIEELSYEAVSVAELHSRLGARGGAMGAASITFDDALARTAETAVHPLLERGMSCTIFVPTGLIGCHHPDADGERILDEQQLVELSQLGVEIGAHSVDHLWLPDLSYERMLEQMVRSRATLEDLIGKPVTSMAYPYGAHDRETRRAAAAAGYEVACGCSGAGRWESLCLPREPIYSSASRFRMRLKMAGLYGPVHSLRAAAVRLPRRGVGAHPPAERHSRLPAG